MTTHTNKAETILDILSYLDAQVFEDRYEVNWNKFEVLIIAEKVEDIEYLYGITECKSAPITEDIKESFENIPSDRMFYITEPFLEQFADDLLELLLELGLF